MSSHVMDSYLHKPFEYSTFAVFGKFGATPTEVITGEITTFLIVVSASEPYSFFNSSALTALESILKLS